MNLVAEDLSYRIMSSLKSISRVFIVPAMLMLAACSSFVPPEIKQPLPGSPDITQVRANAEAYLSQQVRWGGVILDIENKGESSELSIVAFPLNEDGEPQVSDQSSGRFIAVVDTFLEPLVYSRDRVITVKGNLLRTETRVVDEFPYQYPVVQVAFHYLWPVQEEPDYSDYPPYWYDPWYPYYPYYYPYYAPYYPRHHRH